MTPDELMQHFGVSTETWGGLLFRKLCYYLGMNKRKVTTYREAVEDLADCEGCAVWEVEVAMQLALSDVLRAPAEELEDLGLLVVDRTVGELARILAFEIATGHSIHDLKILRKLVKGEWATVPVDSLGKSTAAGGPAAAGPAAPAGAERPHKAGNRRAEA
jgi:hypothetical protein